MTRDKQMVIRLPEDAVVDFRLFVVTHGGEIVTETPDAMVSKKEVMAQITEEYNSRMAWRNGGLQLAWIEKAVNDAPEIGGVDEKTNRRADVT